MLTWWLAAILLKMTLSSSDAVRSAGHSLPPWFGHGGPGRGLAAS